MNLGTILGSSIFIWYKTGGDGEPIQAISVEYGEGIVPAGFTKVDVDLNHGAGGDRIWLMYRRGYSGTDSFHLIAAHCCSWDALGDS